MKLCGALAAKKPSISTANSQHSSCSTSVKDVGSFAVVNISSPPSSLCSASSGGEPGPSKLSRVRNRSGALSSWSASSSSPMLPGGKANSIGAGTLVRVDGVVNGVTGGAGVLVFEMAFNDSECAAAVLPPTASPTISMGSMPTQLYSMVNVRALSARDGSSV